MIVIDNNYGGKEMTEIQSSEGPYEGHGYWSYALHWHVRYTDLISRATGEKAFDLPVLRDSWKFALYLSLP